MNVNELKQILIDQAGQRAQGQNAAVAKEFIEAYVALCDEERRATWGIEAGNALRLPPGLESGAALEVRSETNKLLELRRDVVDRIVREISRRNIHITDTRARVGWRYKVYEGEQLIRECASVEECEMRVAQLLQMSGAEASAMGHSLRDAINAPIVIGTK